MNATTEIPRNPACNKLRAYIATNQDGTEKRYLLTAQQAPTCEEGAAYLRNTWCLPVASLRDQLSVPERAVFNDDVRDILTAMAE
jgi:hypothetical protein